MTIGKHSISPAAERSLFFLITFLHLVPLLAVPVFTTLDGPSHLYNSHVLKEMLFGDREFYEKFHHLNFLLLPNVLGHFFLLFIQIFISDLMAEKLFQIAYVVSFAYSFRYLVNSIYSNQKAASYFGFVLIYTFLCFLGFYNYVISLVFYFLAFGFWLRHRELNSHRDKIIMASLILLTFLSHSFMFVLLLVSISVMMFLEIFIDGKNKSEDGLGKKAFKLSFHLFVVSIPALVLTAIYFTKFGGEGEVEFVPVSRKFNELLDGRFLIAFIHDVEKPYSRMLAWFFCILFFVGLILRFRRKDNSGRKSIDTIHYLTIFFLTVYVFIPESMASGEFMTARMQLMCFIFIVLCGGVTLEYFGRFKWVPIFVALFLSVATLNSKWPAIKQESDVAMEFYNAGKKIPPHSVVLPLHHSSDWFIRHFSNYLGLEKPVLILDNYEADRKYFPILWNEKTDPQSSGNLVGPDFCFDIVKYELNSNHIINYVSFWNHQDKNDSCSNILEEKLKYNFRVVYSENEMELYDRSKNH